MSSLELSKALFERLPQYLHYLRSLDCAKTETISATAIARALKLGEVQVRKDLGSVSGAGKPRVGYEIQALIMKLEDVLGYGKTENAVIAGAGKLGNALLGYEGFREYGLCILAGFDTDEKKLGKSESGKEIYPLEKMPEFCHANKVRIGIITVPGGCAQNVCDLMVKSGILAVWNFTPERLTAPSDILIKNENMASSLAILSRHLGKQ